MKILCLIPPSEGKNSTLPNLPLSKGGIPETLTFPFEKPYEIALHATEKDLKCTGKRYEEGIELNKSIEDSQKLAAIDRYSGIMYNAIYYAGMNQSAKKYFEDNFAVLSGMYGIIKPEDMIGNYKLPIETKGLYAFWGSKITDTLNTLELDYVVDFLPNSYKKMIDWKSLDTKVVRIDFYKNHPLCPSDISPSLEGKKDYSFPSSGREGGGKPDGMIKKLTHGVKKVKGEYIYNLCHTAPDTIEDLAGEKMQISENEYHIRVICD